MPLSSPYALPYHPLIMPFLIMPFLIIPGLSVMSMGEHRSHARSHRNVSDIDETRTPKTKNAIVPPNEWARRDQCEKRSGGAGRREVDADTPGRQHRRKRVHLRICTSKEARREVDADTPEGSTDVSASPYNALIVPVCPSLSSPYNALPYNALPYYPRMIRDVHGGTQKPCRVTQKRFGHR